MGSVRATGQTVVILNFMILDLMPETKATGNISRC